MLPAFEMNSEQCKKYSIMVEEILTPIHREERPEQLKILQDKLDSFPSGWIRCLEDKKKHGREGDGDNQKDDSQSP